MEIPLLTNQYNDVFYYYHFFFLSFFCGSSDSIRWINLFGGTGEAQAAVRELFDEARDFMFLGTQMT